MYFSCSQSVLNKSLNAVLNAVSTRTTIPVLKGILIEVNNGVLRLTASDLDITISKEIDVQNSENGSSVLSAKLFGDVVRRLPNAIVSLKENNGKISIKCLGSSINLVAMDSDIFPKIDDISENYQKITFNRLQLKQMIDKTVFAASNDDKRGVLTGVAFSIKPDIVEMAALDGFRLAVSRNAFSGNCDTIIIVDARIMSIVSKILSDIEEDEITVVFDNRFIKFISSDTVIFSKLIEGSFVDFDNILPKNSKTRLVISRNDLLLSIERASLLTNDGKFNKIILNIEGGNISISSKNEEGNAEETLDADITGDDITIGFNSKYISEILKSLDDEEIVFEFSSPVSSCLIRPESGNAYAYLLLPLRIGNY